MGACDISFELDGQNDSTSIRQAFQRKRETDSRLNGSREGYSGDFQTVHDVRIHNEKLFDSYNQAYNYCLDHAKKWDYVIAVKYKVTGKVENDFKARKLQDMRAKLVGELNEFNNKMFDVLLAKLKSTEFVTDRNGCKSRLATKHLVSMDIIRCPVCQGSLLTISEQTKRLRIQENIKKVEQQIAEHKAKLHEKAAAKSNETRWLIAGWGAC